MVAHDTIADPGPQTGTFTNPFCCKKRLKNPVQYFIQYAGEAAAPAKGKKSRKTAASQKEMLMSIEGKRPAAKKAAKPERSTGRRKAG